MNSVKASGVSGGIEHKQIKRGQVLERCFWYYGIVTYSGRKGIYNLAIELIK